jgi:hypothetical protein
MGKFTRKFLNYTKALSNNFHLRRKKFEKLPNLEIVLYEFSTCGPRAARRVLATATEEVHFKFFICYRFEAYHRSFYH